MQRFIVLGLPRSGTTYLSTLLDSHPKIRSAGEYFNPYYLIDKGPDGSDKVVFDRDAKPVRTAEAFFKTAEAESMDAAGFKFMIGHNVTVLRWIARQPDIKIIFVRRENKLAQVASMIKAVHTQQWAKTARSEIKRVVEDRSPGFVGRLLKLKRNEIAEKRVAAPHPDLDEDGKLTVGPRRLSQRWHEMETSDFLMDHWLRSTPNKVLRLSYTDAVQQTTPERLCKFLGVDLVPGMSSPLMKQGSSLIIDRFAHAAGIREYFSRRGLDAWLGDEFEAPQTPTKAPSRKMRLQRQVPRKAPPEKAPQEKARKKRKPHRNSGAEQQAKR